MNRRILIGLALVLVPVLCLAGYIYWQWQVPDEFRDQAWKTYHAIHRAGEMYDSGVLIFEPRMLEAERELDALKRVRGGARKSRRVVELMVTALLALEGYKTRVRITRGCSSMEIDCSGDLELDRRDAEDALLALHGRPVR